MKGNFPSLNGGKRRTPPDYAAIYAHEKELRRGQPRFFSMPGDPVEAAALRRYDAAMRIHNQMLENDVRVMRAELIARGLDPDSAA